MIFSDHQLRVSERELRKLEAALESMGEDREADEKWLIEIERAAIESQISDIAAEIREYEMLRSGEITFAERYSLSDLPLILIQARIAQGLSQSQLAAKLSMKPQQVQRYEASNYMGASLSKLIDVSECLNVKIAESFSTGGDESGSVLSWRDADTVDWSRLPSREMVRRNWFTPEPEQSLVDATRAWYQQAAGYQFVSALHRKKVRGKNLPNETALLAWQARILEKSAERIVERSIPEFQLSDTWLPDLVAMSREVDGPLKAQQLLEEKGVVLTIERHLPESYLDGAAMLSPSGHPVIGMTLRYDRLDNFWFVLFHELGHVFLHLFDSLQFDFFDEDSAAPEDSLEREADAFALETIVSKLEWGRSLSRFALSPRSVEQDAERLGVHPSIIAGRIRRERDDYTILNEFVGQGLVRSMFEEQMQ